MYLYKAGFSTHNLAEVTNHNKLNTEADMRTQLSSRSQKLKRSAKGKPVPLFLLTYFCFGK